MAEAGEVRQVSVAGVATDTVLFPPGPGAAPAGRLALVFVTGNPGAIEFFVPFLRRVWELSGRGIEVCGIAQAGHSRSTATDALLGLPEQIDHKVSFLRERYSGGVPLVLVGHSIGAYMLLRALDRLQPGELNVVRFIGLCPVVTHIRRSRNAWLMAPLIRYAALRNIVSHAVGVVSLLPTEFLQKLVAFGLMVHPHADAACNAQNASATVQIADGRVARNALHLALDEMRDVKGPAQFDAVLQRFGQAAVFVYSPVDGWVAPGAAQELQQRFPACAFVHKREPRMSHMFSLNATSVDCMADCTWGHVRAALQEMPGLPRSRL